MTRRLTPRRSPASRVIEFGQLLAGPYVGTLLGDFGADVVKVEAPPGGDPMRDWGRLRHNDHSLWWSILARNKRSVTLNLRTEARPGARARGCARGPTSWSRTSAPARWRSGASGPTTSTPLNPRAVYARVSGYGQTGRYRDRAGFASAGEAIGGLRHINGYPGPGPAAQRHLARRHARRAVGVPGHPARPLRARRARRRRPGDRRLDHRRLLRDDGVGGARVREDRLRARADRARGCRASRRRNVYRSSDGKWVVIAANHDTLWKRLAALMGRPELGEDPRFDSHHARGEHEDELDELIGALGGAAHGGGARPDRQRGRRRVRAGLLGGRHPRRPALPRARAARRARRRGARRDDACRASCRSSAARPGGIRQAARWTVGRRHGRGAGGAGRGARRARGAASGGRRSRHGVPAWSGRGRDVHRPVPGGRRRRPASGA